MLINTAQFQRKSLRVLRYTHSIFKGVLLALCVVLVSTAYVITGFRVDGHSMQPTLQNGQFLVVDLAAYWFHVPEKGDVVIVQYAGDQSVHFVKRVMGVPGDTVTYNGLEVVLQPKQYFVEGDNRDFSTDSRVYGPINQSQILGHVVGDYSTYPPIQ